MERQYELVISEEATVEIEEIRDFYNRRKKGLGFDCLEDILNCLERIQENPKSFQYYREAKDGIRRGLTKRFSIIILYDIDDKRLTIEVLTIADSQQNWFKE